MTKLDDKRPEARCPTCGSVLAIEEAPPPAPADVDEFAVTKAAGEPLKEWLAKQRRRRWGVRANG